ncbi:MAG TPA: prepilin-type N-terminal cleavage/methylation domain-containing protein [Verrucomicrobiae bacterium]|nr:prepilin-type N-terminal cleavage/methylation domain-containing protein [Verrucomicrobiae bacterium]
MNVPISDRRLLLPPRRRETGPGRAASLAPGFTLIEIMVVVAIIGLIMAMGMPSIMSSVQKEGMRKAVSDIQDVCANARAQAIFQQRTMAVVFYPSERRFEVQAASDAATVAPPADAGNGNGGPPPTGKVPSFGENSGTLPDGVDFVMVDIDRQEFVQADWVRCRFFPNGTADELTLVLHSSDAWKKISVEFATGQTDVSEVDK